MWGLSTTKLAMMRSQLDERQWRLLLGAEANAIGRGGIGLVARAAGVSPGTVSQGARQAGEGGVVSGGAGAGCGSAAGGRGAARDSGGVGVAGGTGLARRSDVAAAVDDEVVEQSGHGGWPG